MSTMEPTRESQIMGAAIHLMSRMKPRHSSIDSSRPRRIRCQETVKS